MKLFKQIAIRAGDIAGIDETYKDPAIDKNVREFLLEDAKRRVVTDVKETVRHAYRTVRSGNS